MPVTKQALLCYPLVAAQTIALAPEPHPLKQVLPLTAETPQVICSDYEVLFEVVQNTDSWLVAPEMPLLQEQQSGRIHRIDLSFPDACNELGVIEQEGRSWSPAAGEFLRLCRQAFGAGGIAD